MAVELQNAFSEVADRVFASVVGVTSFVRRDASSEPPDPDEGDWVEPLEEDRLYSGFKRHRSGSGVVVSAEGDILTAAHVVNSSGGGAVDVIDVELPNGRHVIGRVVGTEPTLNLGVVQANPELYSSERPPTFIPAAIADAYAMQVGYWAIALGKPMRPGTTYAVGTISSMPEHQCYQGDLTATMMQASLRVPPGGYGGPLVSIAGKVVGLTVPSAAWNPDAPARLAPASELALPIDIAMGIHKALKVAESRKSPWLSDRVPSCHGRLRPQGLAEPARQTTGEGASKLGKGRLNCLG